MKAKEAIRLYIIEEQEVYRVAMQTVLASRSDFELLGVSLLSEEGISPALDGLSPQVLIIGAREVTAGLLEGLVKVREANPKVGVILMAMQYRRKDIPLIHRCAVTGKGGFALVSKQSLDQVEQLSNIIVGVNQGQIVLDSRASLLLMGNSEHLWKDLTAREMEVLRLLSTGYSNSAIAQSLFIDVRTVKNHINNLYQKLEKVIDFEGKHPRVTVARFYLREQGSIEEAESGTTV